MPDATCPTCLAEGASEPRPVETRGICRPHYARARRAGTLEPVYAKRYKDRQCSTEGCPNPAKAKGLCASHYARARRGGDPSVPIRREYPATCAVEDCGRPSHGKGLCATHYWRSRRADPDAPIAAYVPRSGTCAVEGCTRDVSNGGLCQRHYQRRIERRVDWDAPVRPKAKNGSGWLSSDGYRMIHHNGRARGEHCVMAEGVLGRPLKRPETVHHVNGDRVANRVDGPFVMDERGHLCSGNLEVWSKAQPAGQAIGPKVDWALDMLETYAEFLLPRQRERVVALHRILSVEGAGQ